METTCSKKGLNLLVNQKYYGVIATVAILLALAIVVGMIALSGNTTLTGGTSLTQPDYVSKVFDKNTVIQINIEANQQDWDNMLENASREEYISVDITVNGEKFQNVGIRTKGNASLMTAQSSGTDKFSFKVDFGQYIKNQTMHGLEEMALNNMIGDSTYMKEYLSYEMFSELGVPTPAYAYANISVNGQQWGLYIANEVVEESFLSRYYGTTGGNLYKPETSEMGGGGNGDRPDMGDFPQFGDMPNMDNFPQNGEMPQMGDFPQNGEMPQMGDFPQNGDMPQMGDFPQNGEMPQMGDFPQNGQMPQNGDMPQMGDFPQNGEMPQMGNTPQNGDMPQNGDASKNQNNNQNNNQSNNQNNNNNNNQGNSESSGRPGGNNRNPMGGGMDFMGNSKGTNLVYKDDNISSYSGIFDYTKTESTTDSDKKRVIEMIKNLNEGTNLEEYLNVEEILKYFAANTFLVNLDSYAGSMKHNYYLYENTNGTFEIIPWDLHLSFASFQMQDGQKAVNFPIDAPVTDTMENSPLISKLLEVDEYKEQYHNYLEQLISNYIDSGKYEQTIKNITELIDEYVKEDTRHFYSYDEYKTAINELKTFGKDRTTSIKAQLAGEQPSDSYGNIETTFNVQSLGSIGGGGGMGGGPWGDNKRENAQQQQDTTGQNNAQSNREKQTTQGNAKESQASGGKQDTRVNAKEAQTSGGQQTTQSSAQPNKAGDGQAATKQNTRGGQLQTSDGKQTIQGSAQSKQTSDGPQTSQGRNNQQNSQGVMPQMGQMPDSQTMQKAMEIIKAANGNELSYDQTAQLIELGIDENMIPMLTQTSKQGLNGMRPGALQNGRQSNQTQNTKEGNFRTNGQVPDWMKNGPMAGEMPGKDGAPNASGNASVKSQLIIAGSSLIVLVIGLLVVTRFKRRRFRA